MRDTRKGISRKEKLDMLTPQTSLPAARKLRIDLCVLLCQVTSLNSMSGILEDALREYNETYATMDLVLFEDAMKHVRGNLLRPYPC